MLTEQQLKDFINEHNYDLRTSGNGRWIDQKCTPDVISFIADCILQYNDDENTVKPFTKNDIWHYQYAEEYVTAVFSKPSTNSDSLENEIAEVQKLKDEIYLLINRKHQEEWKKQKYEVALEE